MRKYLVAGNWKMNGSKSSITQLLAEINDGLAADIAYHIAVFPPDVYLQHVSQLLTDSPVICGAQNVSCYDSGAYTGDVSASMLQEFGCQMVLVGHSERRSYYNETNQQLALKFRQVKQAGMIPVLCLGESLEQRKNRQTFAVIEEQLASVIELVGIENIAGSVLAYEPVWAIGTGETASADEAQEVHQFIRSQLALKDATIARQIQILYGGSCKGSNAYELFSRQDVDGGLIGGASLTSENFLAICQQADKLSVGV